MRWNRILLAQLLPSNIPEFSAAEPESTIICLAAELCENRRLVEQRVEREEEVIAGEQLLEEISKRLRLQPRCVATYPWILFAAATNTTLRGTGVLISGGPGAAQDVRNKQADAVTAMTMRANI